MYVPSTTSLLTNTARNKSEPLPPLPDRQDVADNKDAVLNGTADVPIGGSVDVPGDLGNPVSPVADESKPIYTAPKNEFSASDTMASQLSMLTSKDNQLARQAESRALEGANTLGLSSSSMALGAAEGARLREMKDVANNDSNAALQLSLQELKGAQDLNLVDVKDQFDTKMNEYNWGQKFKENADSYGYDKGLIDKQNEWASKLMDKELSSEERRTISTSVTSMNGLFFNTLDSLYNNVDLTTAKVNEGVEEAVTNYENMSNTLASIFDYSFDFTLGD